jgi:hypothetical protein
VETRLRFGSCPRLVLRGPAMNFHPKTVPRLMQPEVRHEQVFRPR